MNDSLIGVLLLWASIVQNTCWSSQDADDKLSSISRKKSTLEIVCPTDVNVMEPTLVLDDRRR
jgi:hypothetical protein